MSGESEGTPGTDRLLRMGSGRRCRGQDGRMGFESEVLLRLLFRVSPWQQVVGLQLASVRRAGGRQRGGRHRKQEMAVAVKDSLLEKDSITCGVTGEASVAEARAGMCHQGEERLSRTTQMISSLTSMRISDK